MSIRFRLALVYALVTGLLVFLVGGFAYAIHSRAQYDQVDALLDDAVDHVAIEYGRAASNQDRERVLTDPLASDVVVRVTDPSIGLRFASPNAATAPTVDPHQILTKPTAHAYDALIGLGVPVVSVDRGEGMYGVVTDRDGVRWRVYVQQLDGSSGNFEALASLAQIDASVARLRMLVPAMALLAAIISLASGWYLATCVLRPVATLTETADTIARSHEFRQRVPSTLPRDELGRLAETFNRMLESLEHAYRTQQRFVADASHELRAPLTVIQANLELLTEPSAMPEADRQVAVADARREVQRVGRLVGDLLVLARADSGQTVRRQPVELDRVLFDVLHEGRALARGQKSGIDSLEPVVVAGDPDRLKQLILILVDNAINYTVSGGQVTLGLRLAEGFAEVHVRDTGVGIPAKDLPYVFNRFYRAEAARSLDPAGTGLGLSIARWIVEQHGGTVTLDTVEGQGTTAVVRLPLSA